MKSGVIETLNKKLDGSASHESVFRGFVVVTCGRTDGHVKGQTYCHPISATRLERLSVVEWDCT
jgi:hypothetical protein